MELFYIANDPAEAREAESAGADRIFIDLECIGKAVRQGGKDTFISAHTLEDLPKVRAALSGKAKLMVRINPLHDHTHDEIERVIGGGADYIMLPMLTTTDEVELVAERIDRRAKFVPLVETAAAMARLDSIIACEGVDEVHVGLNDLSISLGLDFLFEPLALGLIDFMAQRLNAAGISWGFGGVARIGCGDISAEMIVKEHVRLNSSRVILSRQFRCGANGGSLDLCAEIRRLRESVMCAKGLADTDLEENRKLVAERVSEIVKRKTRTQ